MNLNAIPVLGWLLSFTLTVSTAIPFWICWTVCGIGETYFQFLPPVYRHIPFWNAVGLFIVIGILKSLLTPHFATVTQRNGKEQA